MIALVLGPRGLALVARVVPRGPARDRDRRVVVARVPRAVEPEDAREHDERRAQRDRDRRSGDRCAVRSQRDRRLARRLPTCRAGGRSAARRSAPRRVLHARRASTVGVASRRGLASVAAHRLRRARLADHRRGSTRATPHARRPRRDQRTISVAPIAARKPHVSSQNGRNRVFQTACSGHWTKKTPKHDRERRAARASSGAGTSRPRRSRRRRAPRSTTATTASASSRLTGRRRVDRLRRRRRARCLRSCARTGSGQRAIQRPAAPSRPSGTTFVYRMLCVYVCCARAAAATTPR